MALRPVVLGIAVALLAGLPITADAGASRVTRESDITSLRLGQRVQVDDGSCPAGQIKEVVGVALTRSGVTRKSGCVPRHGAPR